MKAIIILNYASKEDIGKKTSIRLKNEENEWIEDVVIKPMPHKLQADWYTDGYKEGFNACLKDLEK